MLMAQLHGKMAGDVWVEAEDLLTSTVFGLLKYLPPTVMAGILARATALEEDETPRLAAPLTWSFWPWWDTCEPDVVLEDDHGLYVVEVKLTSEFSQDEIAGHQLRREWDAGLRRARSRGKVLWLIAVTNDAGLPAEILRAQLAGSGVDLSRACWLSWMTIGQAVRDAEGDLPPHLADDLLELLARQGLAPFMGFGDAVARARAFDDRPPTWPVASAFRGTHAPGPTFRHVRRVAAGLAADLWPPWRYQVAMDGHESLFARAAEHARAWETEGGRAWRPRLG